MRASLLPTVAVVAFLFLLGSASSPVVACLLGVVLFLGWLLLSAPDRRAARARKAGVR